MNQLGSRIRETFLFAPKPVQRRGEDSVFVINFIRRQTLALRLRRTMIRALVGYLALQAFLYLVFMGLTLHAYQSHKQLLEDLQGPAFLQKSIPDIEADFYKLEKEMTGQMAIMDRYTAAAHEKFRVSLKLAAIARTLPARTWVVNIRHLANSRGFRLEGHFLLDPERPYDTPIKDWLDALKDDEEFGRGLSRLDLERSTQKTHGRAEIQNFEWVAEWTEAEGANRPTESRR